MMDENPNKPGENSPETEPIVAPDEVNNEEGQTAEPETTATDANEPAATEVEAPETASEPEPESMEPEAAESEPESMGPEEAAPEAAEPAATPEPATASEPTTIPVSEPEPAQPMMDPAMKKKGHGGLISLVIIAILLVIAGVVICLILLNSADTLSNNSSSTNTTENPTPKPEPTTIGKVSTVSCTAGGNAWSYAASIEIEDDELKAKKISAALKMLDGYSVESLTEEEKSFLDDAAESLSEYGEKDDAGVTFASTGDYSAGAGYSVSVEIDREKVVDEGILKDFLDLDGTSAEEYAKEAENGDKVVDSIVCTVE